MTDIQPQLWVADTAAATRFYERAFGAVVEHRVGDPGDADGVVALAIGEARFWLSGTWEEGRRLDARTLGGATARYLLVVEDPAAMHAAALASGATELSPVASEHGWEVGRSRDPFGHEWEIGRPLIAWPPAA